MQNGIAFQSVQSVFQEPGRPSHVFDYLALIAIIVGCGYLFLFLAVTREEKFETALLFLLAYLLWGILHHYREQTLTWTILIEFLAFTACLTALITILWVVL